MALASEFQSAGVLKNPPLRLLSAEDGSTRVLRDSPPPPREEQKEKNGREVRLLSTCRISSVRPSVDSNSRVIKFLQFKFLPPISRPPTEKLDVMIYRG